MAGVLARHPPARRKLLASPADALGGREEGPLWPHKRWIEAQREEDEEGEGRACDADLGSEIDGYEVA